MCTLLYTSTGAGRSRLARSRQFLCRALLCPTVVLLLPRLSVALAGMTHHPPLIVSPAALTRVGATAPTLSLCALVPKRTSGLPPSTDVPAGVPPR